ncbi:hypothetical protein [Stenotrophomonas nitritireducens]|uniref:hypothetical protein n=1 Tax=Stenotrophomonas nitritireducens TaxID=83617 RepID=UPI003D9832C4
MTMEKAMNLAMRMLLAGLLLVLAATAGATAQVPDRILVEGREYALNTNPLESQLRDRRGFLPENVSRSTANWRGYVAHWAIDGDRLLLRKVEVRLYDAENESSSSVDLLTRLFPEGGPVAATWYSGALVIPDGRLVNYVHMGYGSTYAHYRVYRIAQGRVVEALSMDAEQFHAWRERKFQAFRQTAQYREAVAHIRKESRDMSADDIDGFVRGFYAEQYMGQ